MIQRPKSRPHIDAASLLRGWLIQIFGARFVNSGAPIDVAPEDNPTNEPVPDIIVLQPQFASFRERVPQPVDLDFVVEISDTSLQFDLTTKASLYSRAGIPEYWVLDVSSRRLLVHRNSQAGPYESLVAYDKNEGVAPLVAPDSTLPIHDLFPA